MTCARLMTVVCFGMTALAPAAAAEPSDKVSLLGTPGHGIQPQVAVDDKGALHLIHFTGKDGGGGP